MNIDKVAVLDSEALAAAMAEAQDVLQPETTREQQLAQLYFNETEKDETRDFIGGLFLILYYYSQVADINRISMGVDGKFIEVTVRDFTPEDAAKAIEPDQH